MGRRILITLCALALGAAAWWIMRSMEVPDEGLVVHVRVEDQQGAPLSGAQVQAVYAPGWRKVDGAGRIRLTHLLLRAEEDPSAEALRAALQVRASFYTQRRGFDPTVIRRDDGSWDVRYALHHHGVFRLSLGKTHLGSVKAFLEPDEAGHRWEAMDRGNVARPDAPATYRIYPGIERLVVRLVGEPDDDGVVTAATRRYFFDPPAIGHVIEKTVTAEEVKPIIGTVVPPSNGPKPPSLKGTVWIAHVDEEERRVPHSKVDVGHGGTFVARAVGPGRYELRADFAFLADVETHVVRGGDVVELRSARLRPWLVVEHVGLNDAGERRAVFHIDGETAHPQLFSRGTSIVPVRGTKRRIQLRVDVPGSDDQVPMTGSVAVDVGDAGPTAVRVEMSKAPAGSLLVRVPSQVLADAGGATVQLEDGRETTLIARLAEEARFANVGVGTVTLTVAWNREGLEATTRTVEVKAGEATLVEIEAP